MDLKQGVWKWLLGNKQMSAQNRTTPVTLTSFGFLQLCVIKSPLFEEGRDQCCPSGCTQRGCLLMGASTGGGRIQPGAVP